MTGAGGRVYDHLMNVREVNAQNVGVDEWVLVNDGDDRSFSAAQVVTRVTAGKGITKTVTLTLLFAGGRRYPCTYYFNQKVSRIANL